MGRGSIISIVGLERVVDGRGGSRSPDACARWTIARQRAGARFVHPIPDGPIVRVCLDGLRTAVVGYPEALLRHFRKRFNVR